MTGRIYQSAADLLISTRYSTLQPTPWEEAEFRYLTSLQVQLTSITRCSRCELDMLALLVFYAWSRQPGVIMPHCS